MHTFENGSILDGHSRTSASNKIFYYVNILLRVLISEMPEKFQNLHIFLYSTIDFHFLKTKGIINHIKNIMKNKIFDRNNEA